MSNHVEATVSQGQVRYWLHYSRDQQAGDTRSVTRGTGVHIVRLYNDYRRPTRTQDESEHATLPVLDLLYRERQHPEVGSP